MPTAATDAANAAITNAINVERYKEQYIRSIMPILNKLSADVEVLILRMDVTSARDVNAKLKQINQKIDAAFNKILVLSTREFPELVETAIEQEEEVLAIFFGGDKEKASITEKKKQSVIAPILASFVLGKKYTQHLKDVATAAKNTVSARVRGGISDAENITIIAKGVRGTKSRRYQDGKFITTLRNMDAIGRSAIQSFVSKSKIVVYKAAGITSYRWVSVIDGNTSPVCMGRSGKIYIVGSGPLPPAHYRCRSTITPYRRGMQVPEDYSSWLRAQPKSIVQDILGKTKAKMFLDGNVTLDKFTTTNGRELTIKELRDKIKK
ncbi:minor capsid protein [Candidatus Babeliales bacterium]|nr:minor capsid protein [Candidatus Babeliales bacterium]